MGSPTPNAAPRPCSKPGCGALTHERYCDEHKVQEQQAYDARRGNRHERGYNSKWDTARKAWLERHPLCEYCPKDRQQLATEVDHFVPHKGDMRKFWDTSNWRSACKPCHSRKTAREDGRWGDRSPRGGTAHDRG